MEAFSGALWKLKKCDPTVKTGEDKPMNESNSIESPEFTFTVFLPEEKDQVFFLRLLGLIRGIV